MAEKVQVDVELTGADKAEKGLDRVADAAERLEDHDDIRLEADADTDDARRGLDDVATQADELDGRDSTITARLTNETSGPLADIFGDLDKLETRAKEAGDQLDNVARGGGGGGGPRAQAIADLTGPLGDVSGQASDLAGVFDGMGDILEGLGPKFGISADKMVGAIGGVGFAVTAAATLWGLFQAGQEEARRKQEEVNDAVRAMRDAVEEGNLDKAAQALVDAAGDAKDAFDDLGLSAEEAFDFVTGADNLPARVAEELDRLKQAASDAQTELGNTQGTQDAVDDYQALIDKLVGARGRYLDANGAIDDQNALLQDARGYLQNTEQGFDDTAGAAKRLEDATRKTSDAFDRLRGAVNLDQEMLRVQTSIETAMTNAAGGVGMTADEVLSLKDDIINLAETAKANPAEVKSTLDKIDRGDLAAVKSDAESYYSRAPVEVTGKLTITNLVAAAKSAAAALFPQGGVSSTSAPASAGVVNVTQHLPRGWRGDALSEARRAAQRSGGLYQRFAR